jgi:hypothetical protein
MFTTNNDNVLIISIITFAVFSCVAIVAIIIEEIQKEKEKNIW